MLQESRVSSSIRAHLRNNVIGYVALFFALTMGTAYATHPGGENTISTEDIIDGEVRQPDIQNGAVTTADISNSNGVRSEDVRDDTLAGGGLTDVDLAPESVGSSELTKEAIPADGSLDDGSTKLAKGSVDFEELDSGAVRSASVLDGSLLDADLADGAVTNTKLGSLSVSTGKLADGAVTNTKLGNLSVSNGKIGTSAVTGDKIGSNAVGPSELQNDSIGTPEIQANAVHEAEILADEVGSSELNVITDRTNSVVVPGPFGDGSVTATCNANEVVISGGVSTNGFFYVTESFRSAGGPGAVTESWHVEAENQADADRTLTAHAYCLGLA